MSASRPSRLIHLVRHGETTGQSSIRFWGRTDVPLSEHGRAQVLRLAGVVAPLHVDAVVHSPLSRAAESAEILVRALQLDQAPTHAENDFAEIDFGHFEGLTREEIAARDGAWFATWERGAHLGYPGGETLSGFAARVRAALARTLARTEGDVLVVAQRGVIRRIAEALVPGAGDSPSALASLSTLRLEPPAVVRWNVVGG